MSGVEVSLEAFSPVIDDIYSNGKARFRKFFENRATKTFKNRVARHVKKLEEVKTIWQKEKLVNITDFYFPSKVTFSNKTREVDVIDELSADRNSIVVQGTQGQGKSIFLRYLAIQQLQSKRESRIPIFIELKNCRPDYGILALALDELQAMGFSPAREIVDYYFESGHFVLLLDAFDEVKENIIDVVLLEIEHFVRVFPKTQTIVTSRPESEITKSSLFTLLKLSPLIESEILPFLKKLGLEDQYANELSKTIHQSRTGICQLVNTPLLLTLAAILYSSHQEIPESLSEFYNQLFNVLFTRHDRTKPGLRRPKATSLSEVDLRKVFDAFCFITQKQNIPRMSEPKFLSECQIALKAVDVPSDASAFLKDIVQITCLMVRDGLEYAFVHRSVQEFHAASFVASSSDEFCERFYRAFGGARYHTWHLPIQFLSEIDRRRWLENYAQPTRQQFLLGLSYARESKTVLEAPARTYLADYKVGFYEEKAGIALIRYPSKKEWSEIDQRAVTALLMGMNGIFPAMSSSKLNDLGIAFELEDSRNDSIYLIDASSLILIKKSETLEILTALCEEVDGELQRYEDELRIDQQKLLLL